MKNDETPPEENYPVSSAKLSKTPSWIMLGFVLGVAFVLALPPLRKAPPITPEPPGRSAEPAAPPGPRDPPLLTTIEAVFAAEEPHAVWTDDVTEVALWNARDHAFSDYYEVRRVGGARYFRSISALTRRIIERGKPRPESPLQFTESEEQYREWYQHGRSERTPLFDFRPASRAAPSPTPVPSRPAPSPAPPLMPIEIGPIAPPLGGTLPEKK